MKRKLLFALVAIFMGCSMANAQEKGDFSAGFNLQLATKLPTLGVGLNLQYQATDAVRLVGNFDYFIQNHGLNAFDITVDGHYLFPLSGRFTVYPVVGMGISILSSGGFSRVPFVANIGGGCQYQLSERLRLNFEIKGRLGNGICQALIGPSLNYAF